jgi:hypothetical protein
MKQEPVPVVHGSWKEADKCWRIERAEIGDVYEATGTDGTV